MRIIFMRHGESIDDTINCYGGAADFALSDLGRREAKEAAQTFKDVVVDKIYSSPLKRAKHTAEEVDAIKQCGVTVVENFKERNSFGVLSGCNKETCQEIYGYLLADIKGKPGDYYSGKVLLGAEPHFDFDQRVEEAVATVINDAIQKEYQTIVVVTHGNVTRSIYQNILNFEKKIELDHVARTVVGYHDEAFTLVSKEGVYEY